VLALDEECVLIRDAFPKARAHALVLPRAAGLDGVADLTTTHLPLLARMQARRACGPGVQGCRLPLLARMPGALRVQGEVL
jgi:hypothetical protein